MAAKTSEWRPGPSVCRCCLTEGCYKDISTEYFWMGKREVYEEMLSDTLSINIAFSQSGGPNSNSRLICEPCISRLRDATDFRRQVLECERTFMQHLDPASSSLNVEDSGSAVDADVKLEAVKQEATVSDEDFDDHCDFLEDDDDLDEVPLTKLASKVPKKESVDLLDLLDNSQVTVKRKSTTKAKASPSKKVKITKEQKPSSSKVVNVKPEKKKKDENSMQIMKRNAQAIIRFTTAYPFRLPESNVVCVYCRLSFEDPTDYGNHMMVEHEDVDIKKAFAHIHEGFIKADCTDLGCRMCLNDFDTLPEIAEHLKDIHDIDIVFEEELGVLPFKFEQDKLSCGVCGQKCPNLRTQSRHIHRHFVKYVCEKCGKAYNTISNLRKHINNFCSIGEFRRKCIGCKMIFKNFVEKNKHLEVSKSCRQYTCNECDERFCTWKQKINHVENVHGVPKRKYYCSECGDLYYSANTLRKHFNIKHTNNYSACTYCDRKFIRKDELKKHIVVHTGEKDYTCNVCSKAFNRKSTLVQHMWIHSDVKRYVCELCDKPFNQKVCWQTHMKARHPEITEV